MKQAEVAQLVEQLIRNQQVGGSSPLLGSYGKRTPYGVLFLYVLEQIFTADPADHEVALCA